MLVSVVSSLSPAQNNSYSGVDTGKGNKSSVKNNYYDHYNYFGANKDNNSQNAVNEMFHKIALWREFCEKNVITDESQKETFNYLA